MADNVNHPAHYTDGKYETIDFIERNLFDYHDGNAIKYISRAGKKDPDKTIEDLEKAKWYIHRANNKLNYDEKAITVYDYILDKKLSPPLSAVIALIETSQYEEAEQMLEAEIERMKKEQDTICIKADKIQLTDEMLKPRHNRFVEIPYFDKVICIKSNDEMRFTVGKIYMTHGDRIMGNKRVPVIFKSPFYSVEDLNLKYSADYGTIFDSSPVVFIEYKGEG